MSAYDQSVATRYHIYNSLFLNLPFHDVYRTGTLLPLLQRACELGFQKNRDCIAIIEKFFREYVPHADRDSQFDLLFGFIQYIERQIVLFDSIEDAAFGEINDLEGGGTVSALLLRAKTEDRREVLKSKLEDFGVRIVLTAHPTQFYPGSVLAIINDLGVNISTDRLDAINLLLHQLGKTAMINREKPTPYKEASSLCWYLENVFYEVIPAIILQIIAELGIGIDEWHNDDLLKIGFWPGGDRDGNPFVTSDTTLQVAARLKETVLKCYHRDLRILKRRLTFNGVDAILSAVEQKIYHMAYGQAGKGDYGHAGQLLEDLLQARAILLEQHDSLFLEHLDAVILKVRVFGFYLASMDIRQDSCKHEALWDAILQSSVGEEGLNEYRGLDEQERIDFLLDFKGEIASSQLAQPFNQDMINSILAIADIQQQNGIEGCQRYVLSNCGSALDVIHVFALARRLLSDQSQLQLDIVPLFETIEDLRQAPQIMETLYSQAEYRAHLKGRNNKQTIMLGFSDGTKDGGYLCANWSIYRAKEHLTKVSRQHGFATIFFDGRGGPPGRGGGNTHDFYASLGDSIDSREVQITIQGQTVSSNFGRPVSCRYNMEQLLSAGIENEIFHKKSHLQVDELALLDDLAEEAYRAYLILKGHPQFVPYLEKITPLAFFSETNIGSRPVKRGQSAQLKFEDLRAIPFVGSWALMKQNVPGFYGVGSALSSLKKAGRLKELQDLYQRSLLFRTLLSNSMMSLTKSFFPATAYLKKDREFAEFWQLLYEEFNLSREMILEVSQLSELMESNPANRDSVKLREKIVLPLITIQQFALQHLRAGVGNNRALEKIYRDLVLRCMFGIINAGRNSA